MHSLKAFALQNKSKQNQIQTKQKKTEYWNPFFTTSVLHDYK